jgi:hypothetical protein
MPKFFRIFVDSIPKFLKLDAKASSVSFLIEIIFASILSVGMSLKFTKLIIVVQNNFAFSG